MKIMDMVITYDDEEDYDFKLHVSVEMTWVMLMMIYHEDDYVKDEQGRKERDSDEDYHDHDLTLMNIMMMMMMITIRVNMTMI